MSLINHWSRYQIYVKPITVHNIEGGKREGGQFQHFNENIRSIPEYFHLDTFTPQWKHHTFQLISYYYYYSSKVKVPQSCTTRIERHSDFPPLLTSRTSVGDVILKLSPCHACHNLEAFTCLTHWRARIQDGEFLITWTVAGGFPGSFTAGADTFFAINDAKLEMYTCPICTFASMRPDMNRSFSLNQIWRHITALCSGLDSFNET